MPTLFIFLLKVNAALLVFCAGYYFVLRHLTFYTLNRIYLVSAILFATIYPEINLSGFLQRHQQMVTPVQAVVFKLQEPAKSFVKPLAHQNYWAWAEVVFWTGVILLTLRLLVQLHSLLKLYRNSVKARIYEHDVRVIAGDSGPFSFWRSIYVNPSRHEPADLRSILVHEQIHVNEWHTLDIMLSELSTIFYWFNPGVWLMKKAVRENIEFITDRKIIQSGADTKQYQYSLVNVSFAAVPQGLVNHFNISTIKKRIIMMNAKRSSKFNLTRYVFLVPAIIALLLVFSISKAALVTKNYNTYKALTNTISRITSSVKLSHSVSIPGIVHIKEKAKAKNVVKAASLKIMDTVNNGKVMIATKERTDSLTYIINGVKAKKADFKALDPDKIQSIELLTGEQANKLLDELDNKHSVLCVTTDDSEAGKKFKEKIDALNNNRFILEDKVTAVNITAPKNAAVIAGKTTGVWRSATINKGTLKALKKSQTFTTVDGKVLANINEAPVVFQYKGFDSVESYSVNTRKGTNFKLAAPKYKMAIIKRKVPLTMVYSTQNFKYAPNKIYVDTLSSNSETNISHLSNKLIMIDGKEATEHDLKKLSAADIESMSIKSGGEITDQYGNKAKNGVVFIVTKKGR